MKKLLITLALALFFFSCDNENTSEGKMKSQEQGQEQEQTENKPPEQGNKNPKIYKVTYNGNGNTEGEVPVDDNLYAEGDTFTLPGIGNLQKEGYHFDVWLIKYAKVHPFLGVYYDIYGIKDCLPGLAKGKFDLAGSLVIVEKSDVEIYAGWALNNN